MPKASVNDIELDYEVQGEGAPTMLSGGHLLFNESPETFHARVKEVPHSALNRGCRFSQPLQRTLISSARLSVMKQQAEEWEIMKSVFDSKATA